MEYDGVLNPPICFQVGDPFVLEHANNFFFSSKCCTDVDRASKLIPVSFTSTDTDAADSSGGGGGGGGKTDDLLNDKVLARLLNAAQQPGGEGDATPVSGVDATTGASAPSWKVTKVGPSRDYAPAKGLTGAGYIAGSNFLLPWNIPLPKKHQRRNAAAVLKDGQKSSAKGGQKSSVKNAWNIPQATVTVTGDDAVLSAVSGYIGCEYECPLGCRFINSGPHQMVARSESGIVKDTAGKTLEAEMPVFVQCPSKKCMAVDRGILAQMSRLHIVTPESRVPLALNPAVWIRNVATDAQGRPIREATGKSSRGGSGGGGGGGVGDRAADDGHVAQMAVVGGGRTGSGSGSGGGGGGGEGLGTALALQSDSSYVVQMPRVYTTTHSAPEVRHGMVLRPRWCTTTKK